MPSTFNSESDPGQPLVYQIRIKGHLGREYTLTVAESRGLVRAFDATSRMYVLLVMGGNEGDSRRARFFDSFEITPAPNPVAKPIALD